MADIRTEQLTVEVLYADSSVIKSEQVGLEVLYAEETGEIRTEQLGIEVLYADTSVLKAEQVGLEVLYADGSEIRTEQLGLEVLHSGDPVPDTTYIIRTTNIFRDEDNGEGMATMHRAPHGDTPSMRCALPLVWRGTLYKDLAEENVYWDTTGGLSGKAGVLDGFWYRQVFRLSRYAKQAAHRNYFRRCAHLMIGLGQQYAAGGYPYTGPHPWLAMLIDSTSSDPTELWTAAILNPITTWMVGPTLHLGSSTPNEVQWGGFADQPCWAHSPSKWREAVHLLEDSDNMMVLDVDWAYAYNQSVYNYPDYLLPTPQAEPELARGNHGYTIQISTQPALVCDSGA